MTAHTPQACASEFTAALIRRDIDAALALLTDDAVLFFSNGSVMIGKDAFATMMTTSWKVTESYQYQSNDSQWIVETTDAATLIYSCSWSGVARGARIDGSARGTRVFCKKPGAGWLLAHEHLSTGQWKP